MSRARWVTTSGLFFASVLAVVTSGAAQGGGAAVKVDHPPLASGRAHAVAVRTDGSVLTWGANEAGQLGLGTVDAVNVRRPPTVVPGASGAVTAAAGEEFSLVLLADGSVLSWGANAEGQLGHGPAGAFPRPGQAMPPVPVPAKVVGLDRVTQIAAGARFALALREDGTVMAWGDGQLGALGDGKGTGSGSHYAVPFPRPVSGLAGVTAIAAGTAFGLALLEDGSVRGWGANEYGQLGDEAVDFKALPVTLAGVTNVRSVHAAGRTGLALLTDGSVIAWGKNDCGLLDVPEARLPRSAKPVRIGGLTGVQQLGTSSNACHVLALMADRSVRAWGDNSFLQLGNGPVVEGKVRIPLKGVDSLAGAGYHSYFVMPDRRVLTTGFRMADRVDRVPREIATLDPAPAARCSPPTAPAGAWSFGRDAVSAAGVATADQKAALAKADAFRALLTSLAPDTVQNESDGYRFVRDGKPRLEGALALGFQANYLMSICDQSSGALREIGSSYSKATIVANDLGDLLRPFGEPVEIGGRPVQMFQLARGDGRVGELDAFETSQGRAVLVTRAGQSPYVPVSRGEFLDALERRLQAQGSSAGAAADDLVKQIQEQIEQTRRELTGAMRDTVVAEMEKALAEMKAQLPANQAKLAAGVGEDVAEIRRYRAQAGAADLARPAILAAFTFRGGFADGDPEAGRAIVRLNPEYFTTGRPRHDRQVLVLSWAWSKGHPQDEMWRARFEATFPFGRLPALIDP